MVSTERGVSRMSRALPYAELSIDGVGRMLLLSSRYSPVTTTRFTSPWLRLPTASGGVTAVLRVDGRGRQAEGEEGKGGFHGWRVRSANDW